MIILATIAAYFLILLAFSKITSGHSSNETFFRADRKSPWYMVAFGMVGASVSGVTFVSVPGMVLTTDMTYLQMCLGFIAGYFVISFVLLPIYYRLNLTTIYSYLRDRLGNGAYKTGASFFLLSKMTGAAARFYIVCIILQRFVLEPHGIPFPLTVAVMVLLIWLYTRRGGIKTLVWTDSLQTLCLLAAVILIIHNVIGAMGMDFRGAAEAISADSQSRIFVFDDWVGRQNFFKQLFSGMFVTIVMTGLDQDMMQKNLTCKNLRQAQKDMCTYGFAFFPVNLLFLSLGVLLTIYASTRGIPLPSGGDELLPMFAATGELGQTVIVLFSIGIVAASFSSTDSALTSMTTCFCVDIMEKPDDESLRKKSHIGIAVIFMFMTMAFRAINSTSVIDAIYVLCSYTYGPLLGMFAFGILTRRKADDRAVPFIAVASPAICLAVDLLTSRFTGYRFGYEMLMLNGLLTFLGLTLSGLSRKNGKTAEN